jgi:hypothetical protein
LTTTARLHFDVVHDSTERYLAERHAVTDVRFDPQATLYLRAAASPSGAMM